MMKRRISAAIDAGLIDLLDRLRGKRSRSEVIELAIRDYLRNVLHREGVR